MVLVIQILKMRVFEKIWNYLRVFETILVAFGTIKCDITLY